MIYEKDKYDFINLDFYHLHILFKDIAVPKIAPNICTVDETRQIHFGLNGPTRSTTGSIGTASGGILCWPRSWSRTGPTWT